jgi:O-antigen/teichoic acid export membrane protein
VLREMPWPRRFPGASIRAISGPMLLITLAVPIALQSDRIVLSHVAAKQAVANYSVAVQIFAPVAALIAASAQPLWPIYTKARSQGLRGPGLGSVLLIFCGATAFLCALLVLAADPIGHLIGGPHIDLGVALPVATALAMTVQAAGYPVAMALMDPRGVRVVGLCTVLALPINVGLSIVLGKHLGAPGPLLATFIVSLLVQTIPTVVYANRRAPKGRHRHDPRRAPDALTVQAISAMTGIALPLAQEWSEVTLVSGR